MEEHGVPRLASALAWLQTAIVPLCEVLHYLKGPFHLTHFHTRRNSALRVCGLGWGGWLKAWTVLTKHGSLMPNRIWFTRNHKLLPCDCVSEKHHRALIYDQLRMWMKEVVLGILTLFNESDHLAKFTDQKWLIWLLNGWLPFYMNSNSKQFFFFKLK